MKVKLGEVADQIRGVTYKSQDVEETLSNNSIPLLRANNISNNGIINYDDVIFVKKNKVNTVQLIQKNDILVCASSGSVHLVGKAAQIKEDKLLSFGAFCKVIRPKNINALYLGYFFQSPYYRNTISSLAQGANINNIRNDDIDNLMINIYDDVATQEIVSILDKVTSLIKMRNKQLEKLDILVKSKFIEMFGDNVIASQYSIKISDIALKIGDGLHGTPNYDETGIYAFINGNNLDNGKININKNTKFININEYNRLRKNISNNTILLSINGTLGKLAYYNGEEVALGKSVCYIDLKDSINRVFFYHVLNSNIFQQYLENNANKSTIKNVNLEKIRNCNIFIPPLDLQNQFAKFVEQVEKNKENIKSSLNQLETLYNALMQEYFG